MRNIQKALKEYWGYSEYRPLQEKAMQSVRDGRDSVVILPTGGGKSLCFQAPAVTMPGMAVVISPLISLMKDQVDSLTQCGVSAARIDSAQLPQERNMVFDDIADGTLKLLYCSPERMFANGFIDLLKKQKISFIAVDEAHCVSMWGHDFRPEYRKLGQLKTALPGVAIHAYTATATDQVRDDISKQLNLVNPEILIGSFDRPNLVFKAERSHNLLDQVCTVMKRHKNESGIIYCIRRKDVDQMCADLSRLDYSVRPYHAGMSDVQRKRNQEAFILEKVDTIVATVAFGMGIDKSNVRYVIHTGMPKSLEHYQQESGRAGRDGLEAECSLFYSSKDYGIWNSILRDSEPEIKKVALDKVNDMFNYCTGVTCRHKALLQYFGQDLDKPNCSACDVCLDELDCVKDSLVISQKILSCVVRLDQSFGGEYTSLVLVGSKDKRILQNKHDELSTYNLLSEFDKRIVRDWIEQLISQGHLQKTGEYNVINVTEEGWRVIRGNETPRLLQPAKKATKLSKAAKDSWEGVDRDLFEILRELRREIANESDVPAFVVFGDATLRDMARRIPANIAQFLGVHGVGESKCKKYGERFLAALQQSRPEEFAKSKNKTTEDFSAPKASERAYEPWSQKEDDQLVEYLLDRKTISEISELMQRDVGAIRSRKKKLAIGDEHEMKKVMKNPTAIQAHELFAQGKSLDYVVKKVDRKIATVHKYLFDYIVQNKITDPSPWIKPDICKRITDAAMQVDSERLKPIFDLLNGEISYEDIRVVVSCLRNLE